MEFILTNAERAALFRQDPTTKGDGGWQSLIVGLQEKYDAATGVINVSLEQRRRIRRYAFKYNNGGWEDRLKVAFSSHLGPNLNLGLGEPDW